MQRTAIDQNKQRKCPIIQLYSLSNVHVDVLTCANVRARYSLSSFFCLVKLFLPLVFSYFYHYDE